MLNTRYVIIIYYYTENWELGISELLGIINFYLDEPNFVSVYLNGRLIPNWIQLILFILTFCWYTSIHGF